MSSSWGCAHCFRFTDVLYTWQGKAKQANQGAKVEQAQAAEIARLKRQLAKQTEELAILKKAAAYFARTSK